MAEEKIPVIIIEDSDAELKNLLNCFQAVNDFQVLKATKSSREALHLVESLAPKIIFLKLEMPDLHGFDLMNELNNKNLHPEVVFLSKTKKLIYDSMRFKPLDYFIEPVEKNLIEEMLLRLRNKQAYNNLNNKLDSFLEANQIVQKRKFRTYTGMVILLLNEIVYCKSSGNFTQLYLQDGTVEKVINNLNNTCESLNCKSFYRTGRSHCINLGFLHRVDKRAKKCSLLVNGKQIIVPVSKSTLNYLENLIVNQVN